MSEVSELSEDGTILTRLSHAVREQNWFAAVLEFLIVTAGVLMGVQLASWSEDRQDQAEVERLVERLLPDFTTRRDKGPLVADYYESRIALGRKAERLWTEPGNDGEYVKAAYLTGSYAIVLDVDSDSYALRIGADTIPQIRDDHLRNAVTNALAAQSDEYLRFSYIDSDFRKTVRRIVPTEVQELLLAQCNEPDELEAMPAVSTTECAAELPAGIAAQIAAELRDHPTALGELREHINKLSALHTRVKYFEEIFGEAVSEIEASSGE